MFLIKTELTKNTLAHPMLDNSHFQLFFEILHVEKLMKIVDLNRKNAIDRCILRRGTFFRRLKKLKNFFDFINLSPQLI